MTRQELEHEVQRIHDLAGDDEAAHGQDDDLHQEVLRAIAQGTLVDITPAEAALLALTTLDIAFSRWCA